MARTRGIEGGLNKPRELSHVGHERSNLKNAVRYALTVGRPAKRSALRIRAGQNWRMTTRAREERSPRPLERPRGLEASES